MAIVSGGKAVPVSNALFYSDLRPTFARTAYYPTIGVSLANKFASYGAIYSNQVWVYIVVNKRARATARLPLKVYERTSKGREERRNHPYAELLRRPNYKHDPFFLWLWTSSTLDIYGEAMWVKNRDANGKVAEIWPIHPSNFDVRAYPVDANGQYMEPGALKDPAGYEVGYGYLAGLGSTAPRKIFPESDVIHFRTYNPDGTLRGLSPCEPLRQTLLNEDAARRATAAFWQNGARPAFALSHPKTLSQPVMNKLREQFDKLHAGTDNTGSTVVLEEGMEPKVLSLNMEEAQYILTRKLNREEVAACWDVAPPAVGQLDHATYNNIEELLRGLYRDSLPPHLGLMESVLEQQLRPEFAADNIYGEFLMDEVLRGTFIERADQMSKGILSGFLTPNEARELDNREPKEGGDGLFIPAANIPIGATSGRTAAIPAASDLAIEEQDAKPGLNDQQVRSLMGRLGRAKDVASIDPDRFAEGLNGMTVYVRQAVEDAADINELRGLIRALAKEG